MVASGRLDKTRLALLKRAAVRGLLALLLCMAALPLLLRPVASADDGWLDPYEAYAGTGDSYNLYNIQIDRRPEGIRMRPVACAIGDMDPSLISQDSGGIELVLGGGPASFTFAWEMEDVAQASGTVTMRYAEEPQYGMTGSLTANSLLALQCDVTLAFTQSAGGPEYRLTHSSLGLDRVVNGVQYIMFPLYADDDDRDSPAYLYMEITAVRGLPGAPAQTGAPETVQKQTDAYWRLTETVIPPGIDLAQHEFGNYEALFDATGLLLLDAESGAGVQFGWSRPPDEIPCGGEGTLQIDLGVAPYNGNSWVTQTAFGLCMDIVNAENETLYAEYSPPLYCDVGQDGDLLEHFEIFTPMADGIDAFHRQGNRLRISFMYEGDPEHVVRYLYEFVPAQSYEAAVGGDAEEPLPADGGDEEAGLGPLVIAGIAVAGLAVVGGGIAGLAVIAAAAKAKAAAAVPSQRPAEPASGLSEYERIERETRTRHAEMDRRLGLEDLEKQRAGASAHDRMVRAEMGKIAQQDAKRAYAERVMKKYGTDDAKTAYGAAMQGRDRWEQIADGWHFSGNVAAAGEVVSTVAGAAANAAADVITRIPGCGWYRPVYRIATGIAGETAKQVAFRDGGKTLGQAIKTGLIKGTVKGTFEAARGFVSGPLQKGMTAVASHTFGEMAGAAYEGGDVAAAGKKGFANGVYDAVTRAVTDRFVGKAPGMKAPPTLWDGVKSLLNNREVRVKTAGGTLRNLAKPFIV